MKAIQKIRSALKKIHLNEDERSGIKIKLVQFMEEYPLARKDSLWTRFFLLTRRPVRVAVLACLILIVSTGGVTYASESALPGDFLYPFKVEIVEEVKGALMSKEKRMEWQMERMQRRFEEAELLSLRGKLNEKFETDLAEELSQYSESIQRHMQELEGKGETDQVAEIRLKFKDIVESHQEKNQELHIKFKEKFKEKWGEKGADGLLPLLELPLPMQEVHSEVENKLEEVLFQDSLFGKPPLKWPFPGPIEAEAESEAEAEAEPETETK